MSDGHETIEDRIGAFARVLVSVQDAELTIRLVSSLLTQVVGLLLDASPEKADSIQAELKNKLIDARLCAEASSLGCSEAQSGALQRADSLAVIAQPESADDDANGHPHRRTNSNEAQQRMSVDQPIENQSTTERILGDDAKDPAQEGGIDENKGQQSQPLSLPSSHQIVGASGGSASCQPSSIDNQSRTNTEHDNGDDTHTLDKHGDLPASVRQTTRPADVLSSIQSPQSRQQDLVPESDLAGSTPRPKPSARGDEIRYEMQDGILRLLPTEKQYQNFPRLIHFARELGAHRTGAVKILVPNGGTRYALSRPARNVKALQNRFSIQSRNNGTFQVTRSSRMARLPSTCRGSTDTTTDDRVQDFESLLQTPDWFRDVEYYVDLDARTREERCRLGLPPDSPIFPLEGNRLSKTRSVIPGIHTPYAYWSGSKFGAPFAMHVEDGWLSSVNYLYTGEKIWFVVEPRHLEALEEKLRIEPRKKSCSQFLRHYASYSTKSCLEEWGVPYKVLSQKPTEVVYTFGRAYHQGFSAGTTIAEAVNFAEEDWATDGYQFCKEGSCPDGSILNGMMDLCGEGEPQYDLAQESEMQEDGHDHSDGRGSDDDDDDDEPAAEKNRKSREDGIGEGKASIKGRETSEQGKGKKRKSQKEAISQREQKRRATVLIRHAEVQEVALPPKFLTPAAISDRLARAKIDQKNVLTLSWYFFNIGSPRALLKLHEAFTASRTRKESSLQESANAIDHVVRSLDALDDKEFAIAILRRYYLVRLVKCHEAAVTKYREERPTRNRAQGPSDRYSTLAIDYLTSQSYPKVPSNEKEHGKRRKSLQNRISCGRNWYEIVKEFGYGILALVPISEENPNSSFERLPKPVMQHLISLLKDHRGEFLRPVSELLDHHLLGIISGEEKDRKYRFEQEGRDILKLTIDSPRLLELCGVEEM